MSGNIRLPNITGRTTEEQLQQMKSYLIQAAGELNWALDNIAGGSSVSSANIPNFSPKVKLARVLTFPIKIARTAVRLCTRTVRTSRLRHSLDLMEIKSRI